jgi:signal peptidase I
LQSAGKVCAVQVSGSSMSPGIPNGSEVMVAFQKPEELHERTVGDVLVFPGLDNELIVHRLVKAGEDLRGTRFFICRGDAQVLCDMPVTAEDILGSVLSVRIGVDWPAVPPAPRRSFISRTAASVVLALVTTWAQVSSSKSRRAATSALQKIRARSS